MLLVGERSGALFYEAAKFASDCGAVVDHVGIQIQSADINRCVVDLDLAVLDASFRLSLTTSSHSLI